MRVVLELDDGTFRSFDYSNKTEQFKDSGVILSLKDGDALNGVSLCYSAKEYQVKPTPKEKE